MVCGTHLLHVTEYYLATFVFLGVKYGYNQLITGSTKLYAKSIHCNDHPQEER
jgi:hypothetical protein